MTTEGIDPLHIESLHLLTTEPQEQLEYDGWLVRRAPHDVKRARSVNIIGPSTLPIHVKIDHVEHLYAEAGLPPLFRLTPFSTPGLDLELERRGYGVLDRTLQQVASLGGPVHVPFAALRFEALPLDEWLAIASPMRGQTEAAREAERLRLAASDMSVTGALAFEDDEAIACGLLLQADAIATLMDIHVAERRRKEGFGTTLTAHLLQLARTAGARIAWLNVLADNEAALHTYARFGFRTLYEYWYRLKPAPP